MKPLALFTSFAAIVAFCALSSKANAAVLFEAKFQQASLTGGTQSLAASTDLSPAWYGYHSSTAVNLTSTNPGDSAYRIGIAGVGAKDYLFMQSTATAAATNYFAYTQLNSSSYITIGNHDGLHASWKQNGTSTSYSSRLAVQLSNGNWYVMANPLSASGGNSQDSDAFATLRLNMTSSQWRQLNFTPGTPETPGTLNLSANPAGLLSSFGAAQITGFGFYADIPGVGNPTNSLRFANFQVVPEPGRAMLLSLAGLAFILRRSSRSRD